MHRPGDGDVPRRLRVNDPQGLVVSRAQKGERGRLQLGAHAVTTSNSGRSPRSVQPVHAGVLTGWTERGDRPEFDVVTGVSTGALTAPFAFLGPQYDDALRVVYTELTTRDIAIARPVRGLDRRGFARQQRAALPRSWRTT